MKTKVLVALAAVLCIAAAGDVSAQYSKGPAFAPGMGVLAIHALTLDPKLPDQFAAYGIPKTDGKTP